MPAVEEVKLGSVDSVEKENQPKHIPSTVQADTLFTFTNQLDWIINPLRSKMLSPRYCEEDVSYLGIDAINRIAIPMRCFCDINLHRLGDHLSWYGYYGLAFSKDWGMKKKIQPLQYINPNSHLRDDFSVAFSAALQDDKKNKSEAQIKLQNYILHQIMYYKPYSGVFANRRTGEHADKCYTDECEWRFVPDVSIEGYPPVIFDEDILHAGNLVTISNAMEGLSSISLTFEYSDIKYIIVNSLSDFQQITSVISNFDVDDSVKFDLISKLIVWENSKGDF